MDKPQIVDNIIAGFETLLNQQTWSSALFLCLTAHTLTYTHDSMTQREKLFVLQKPIKLIFDALREKKSAAKIDQFVTIRRKFENLKICLSTEN